MYKTIEFYNVNEPYGCFSNFSIHPIELDGEIWLTSEHYFQAKKFEGTSYEEEIRNAKTPMEAADMGRNRSIPLRSDWEIVKDDIMRTAVKAKFDQHEDVRKLLVSTGNDNIIEHTALDGYWGDNGDGTGKNMLGIILMEVREMYKEIQICTY